VLEETERSKSRLPDQNNERQLALLRMFREGPQFADLYSCNRGNPAATPIWTEMKTFFDQFSNGEMTLIASLAGVALGGVIGGVVAIFTTRYLVKHGPNYGEQIDALQEQFEGLHETFGRLTQTQEDFRLQQAERDQREEQRHENREKKEEAARWKPDVHISSRGEDNRQVNKLVLKSNRQFCLLEVGLIAPSGAKVFDYPMNKPIGCSTGFGVPIISESLNIIASSSDTYFQQSYFDAKLRYRVALETGDAGDYVGEIPFRAESILINNNGFFKLSG
jgi:hypothetical protein